MGSPALFPALTFVSVTAADTRPCYLCGTKATAIVWTTSKKRLGLPVHEACYRCLVLGSPL